MKQQIIQEVSVALDLLQGERAAQESARTPQFLRLLFAALEEAGVRYCVLHSWGRLPQELATDLDLAVHPDDLATFEQIFERLREAGFAPVQRLNYAVSAYFYIFAWFEGTRLRNVCVDVITEHRRNSLILMSGSDLLAGRHRIDCFWVASPAVELHYLLAKKVLKKVLPEHQGGRLKELAFVLGRAKTEAISADLFGREVAPRIADACVEGSFGELIPRLRSKIWLSKVSRNLWSVGRGLIQDFVRRVRRWFSPTGLFVVILGPDGVGKSTAISESIRTLSALFRREKVFHWRPMLLGKRPESGPVTDPHGRAPHSKWWSLARLCLHVLDYWLGYCVVLRPLLARTGLVVFDRYYHDVAVDPERYRYGGPLGAARAVQSWIPKPDMWLVFDAPADLIHSRKQEVTREELQRLRREYLRCFHKLSPSWLIDCKRDTDGVRLQVESAAVELLAERYQHRYGSRRRLDVTRGLQMRG